MIMAWSFTDLHYGWKIAAGIALAATTIYIAKQERWRINQTDVVEIVAGTAERCFATEQGEYGGTYKVDPLEYKTLWWSNAWETQVVGGVTSVVAVAYSNEVTNAIGWKTDSAMLVANDAKIFALIPEYLKTDTVGTTFEPWTVEGLFAALPVGDGTNKFLSVKEYIYQAIGTNGITNTLTNAATYGAWPQRAYVTNFQERYKVINALETTEPTWANTYKQVLHGHGKGLTAEDAYIAACANFQVVASGELPDTVVEQTCSMVLWSNYTYQTTGEGGGGGGGQWVYAHTNLTITIADNWLSVDPWGASTNRFIVGTGIVAGAVKDRSSGRVWLRDTHTCGKFNHANAVLYAAQLNASTNCGYTNWVVGSEDYYDWIVLKSASYINPALDDTEGDDQWTEGNPWQNVSWTNIWLRDEVNNAYEPSTNYNGQRAWMYVSGTNWSWIYYNGTHYVCLENGGVAYTNSVAGTNATTESIVWPHYEYYAPSGLQSSQEPDGTDGDGNYYFVWNIAGTNQFAITNGTGTIRVEVWGAGGGGGISMNVGGGGGGGGGYSYGETEISVSTNEIVVGAGGVADVAATAGSSTAFEITAYGGEGVSGSTGGAGGIGYFSGGAGGNGHNTLDAGGGGGGAGGANGNGVNGDNASEDGAGAGGAGDDGHGGAGGTPGTDAANGTNSILGGGGGAGGLDIYFGAGSGGSPGGGGGGAEVNVGAGFSKGADGQVKITFLRSKKTISKLPMTTETAYWLSPVKYMIDRYLVIDLGEFVGDGIFSPTAEPDELHWAWFSSPGGNVLVPGPDPSGTYTGAPPCWTHESGAWVVTNSSGNWYVSPNNVLTQAWRNADLEGDYSYVVGAGITGVVTVVAEPVDGWWESGGGVPAPPGYGVNTWGSTCIFYQCWLVYVWAQDTAYCHTGIVHRATDWSKLIAPVYATENFTGTNLVPYPSASVPAIDTANEYYDENLGYTENAYTPVYSAWQTNRVNTMSVLIGGYTPPAQCAEPENNKATVRGFRRDGLRMTADWQFLYCTNRYW